MGGRFCKPEVGQVEREIALVLHVREEDVRVRPQIFDPGGCAALGRADDEEIGKLRCFGRDIHVESRLNAAAAMRASLRGPPCTAFAGKAKARRPKWRDKDLAVGDGGAERDSA